MPATINSHPLHHVYCWLKSLEFAAQVKPNIEIETYDDHRMAMAFSLVACCGVPVVILDPGCTRKTFPQYWSVLETVAKH